VAAAAAHARGQAQHPSIVSLASQEIMPALQRLHLLEFSILGALSGLFAAAGAELLGWALARFVLEIPYQTSVSIWFIGIPGGIAVVTLAGWLATRKLTRLSPLRILASE